MIFSEPDYSPSLLSGAHDKLPESLGASLSAAIGDPLLRPTQLIARQAEIDEVSPAGGPAFRLPRPDDTFADLMTPEDLNAEYGALGLSFEKPTTRRAAELIAAGKRDEIARDDIIRRGPQGAGSVALRFGAGLAGSAIDPLNIASAFIPVVGEARFATLMARLGGPTRARLATGAIEGAVGNAITAPLTYAVARSQQLDYHMTDALLDVAFGGFLGAGFHAGAGKVGDWLATRRPETREGALRAAIAQAATGRPVDVEPILRASDPGPIGADPFDPRLVFAENAETRVALLGEAPQARSLDLGDPVLDKSGNVLRFEGYQISPSDRALVDGVAQEFELSDRGFRVFTEQDRQGGSDKVTGVAATTPDWVKVYNANAEQARAGGASAPAMTRENVRKVADKILAGTPLGRAEASIAEAIVGRAQEVRQLNARDYLERRQIRAAAARAAQEDEISAVASREAQADALADPAAAARTATEAAELPKASSLTALSQKIRQALGSVSEKPEAGAEPSARADKSEAPAPDPFAADPEIAALREQTAEAEYLAGDLLDPFELRELDDAAQSWGRAAFQGATCLLRNGNG